jgi:hypothetical protein
VRKKIVLVPTENQALVIQPLNYTSFGANVINSHSWHTYLLQLKPRHPAHSRVTIQHYTNRYYTESAEKKKVFHKKQASIVIVGSKTKMKLHGIEPFYRINKC